MSELVNKELIRAELRGYQDKPDPESYHGMAVEALCKFLRHLGHDSIVREYKKIKTRCG